MRRIIVTEFLTLDGIMESPNEWSFAYWNDEIAKFKFDELSAGGAFLLGRLTYQGFAASWPKQEDKEGFANRMNSLPKFVVSTTLGKLEWSNSKLIRGNVADEVRKLKEGADFGNGQPDQEILVCGSGILVETLMQNHLVDEFRLLVYPLVLGKGKRLFREGESANLKLLETRTFATGVVLLRYEPAK